MEQKKLTKSDLFSMFVRSNLQQASFNFERIHGLGFCYDMIPAIKRLYPLKEDQVAALKRHLVFFNTTPAVCGPVIGVTAAMEEARANGAEIDDGHQRHQSWADGPAGRCWRPVGLGNIAPDYRRARRIAGAVRKHSRPTIVLLYFQCSTSCHEVVRLTAWLS